MEPVELLVKRLVWDEWNSEHIARHAVLPNEVEQALKDKFCIFLRAKQNRYIALGQSDARLITVVLASTPKSGSYYVVTARDMAKKERRFYREQKGQQDEQTRNSNI